MFYKVNYFIQDFIQENGVPDSVLDVGSRNINGTVWDSFRQVDKGMPKEMIGIDFEAGDNVDKVINGHDIVKEFGENRFDLITCCETLEHDDKFWLTVDNMRRATKPGGFMLITVPSIHFFHHDYPSDYYRFTKEAVEKMFEGWTDVNVVYYEDKHDPVKAKPNNSVFAYGRKP